MNTWNEYVQEVRAYAALPLFHRRVAQAEKIICDFLAHPLVRNPYVAWSGGKDSTALVLMVRKYANILAMSEKDDLDYPGEEKYIAEIAKRFNIRLQIVRPEISLFEWLLTQKDLQFDEDMHSRMATLSKEFFYALIDRFNEEGNYDGVFLGLRKYESKGRMMNRAVHGTTYQKKNGQWICNPLSDWTAMDVYAYLDSCGVEPLYVYKHDPENTRKSWFLPGKNTRFGGWIFVKENYPEIYARMLRKFPEIGRYV